MERMWPSVKKVLVTIVVGMLVFSSIAFAETFTIRNGINFGDSKSKVTSLETLPPNSDINFDIFSEYDLIAPHLVSNPVILAPTEYLIFGPGTIAGIPDSYVEYHFNNDKLIGFAYLFRREKGNVRTDYATISSALHSKYGQPVSDGVYNIVGIARLSDDVFRQVVGRPPRSIKEWVIDAEDYAVKIEHSMCVNTGPMDTHWVYYFNFDASEIVEVDSDDL